VQNAKQSTLQLVTESFDQSDSCHMQNMQSPSKSRFIGATLIVAGTTFGAGMLALPMASGKVGFINSSLMLVGMWIFTCFAALITLEINLRFGGGYSISYLAEKTFGRAGKWLASLSIGLLFYALLSAYTTGGATFLKTGVDNYFGISIPFPVMAPSFIVMLGIFVYSSTRHVDYANRFLLFFKVSIFLCLVYSLIPFVKAQHLTHTGSEPSAFWLAIPLFFTSFGFHGSIPTLVNYVGPNPKYLRKVIIVGSIAPLFIYLLWQTVTLGVLSPTGTEEQNVAAFIQHLNEVTQSSAIGYFSNIFTFFAVSTSFLGVAIGLFDYLAESFKKQNTSNERFQTALLTFVPPLFFALFYPNGFIMALGYAAIALSILAILLPVAVAYKLRQANGVTPYKVIGGNVILGVIFLCGLAIILIELIK
jgi:tyrosine-specific transport protein